MKPRAVGVALLTFLAPAAGQEQEGPGLAQCSCECEIVVHTGYALCYDEEYEVARWVGYEFTSDEAEGTVPRKNVFSADPEVSNGSAGPNDYRGSGYDCGHLAPAADFKWSDSAMAGTFFMSNMAPQKPGFNRGIWKRLESQVRNWALQEGVITVITGPILKDPMDRIGPNRVAVPPSFYKVILDRSGPTIKAIGFVLPNESSKKQLNEFAVSVDNVEERTGIDFFAFLPDNFEDELEKQCEPRKWFGGSDW
jgi:endonuclease G